jgi:hypothetical protein
LGFLLEDVLTAPIGAKSALMMISITPLLIRCKKGRTAREYTSPLLPGTLTWTDWRGCDQSGQGARGP